MPKSFKSDAFQAVHETVSAMHRIGAVDDDRMRHFDELCSDKTATESARPASAVFAVYKDATGRWQWQLTAPNGEALAVSASSFKSKKACMATIEALRHLEDAVVKG